MDKNDTLQQLIIEDNKAKEIEEKKNIIANQDQLFNRGGNVEQEAAQILANNKLPVTQENIARLYNDIDFQATLYDSYNISPTTPESESISKTLSYYKNRQIRYNELAENAKSMEEKQKYLALADNETDKINTYKAKLFRVEQHNALYRQKFEEELKQGKWKDNGDGTYTPVFNSNIEKITSGAIVPETKVAQEILEGKILRSAADQQTDQALNDYMFNTINARPLYNSRNTGFRWDNQSAPLYDGQDILGPSGSANIISSLIDKKNNTEGADMSDQDIIKQVQEAMKDTNIQALARLAVRQNLVKSKEDFINLLFHNPTFEKAGILSGLFGDYKDYGIGYKFISKGVNDLINNENSEEANHIANLFFDNSPQGRANLRETLRAFKAE